jgi:hypothetical protein
VEVGTTPKQRAIHPGLSRIISGGTTMSITTARQMARQAAEARRAAKQNGYSVQSLRRQQLID